MSPALRMVLCLPLLILVSVPQALLAGQDPSREPPLSPVVEVQSLLSNARAAARASRVEEAETLCKSALARARALMDRSLEARALTMLGGIFGDSGRANEAIARHTEALEIFRRTGERSAEAGVLLNMGAVFCDNLHQFDRATECFEKALAIYRGLKDRKGELNCRQNLGVVTLNQGRPAQALEQFLASITVYREMGDRSGEATASLMAGTTLCDSMGDARKALPYFERAGALFGAEEDLNGRANALHNIGVARSKLGDLADALRATEQSVQLFSETRNRQSEAVARNGLGVIQFDMQRPRDAIATLERALVLHREVGNRFGEGSSLSNLGRVYAGIGETGRALECYSKALDVQKNASTPYVVANTLGSLAGLYLSMGQPAQARAHIHRALELHRSVSDLRGEAADIAFLGRLHGSIGRHKESLRYFEQSLALSKRMEDREGIAAELANIGKAWAHLGRPDRALVYYRKALPLHRAAGNARSEAITLGNIGAIHLDRGQLQASFRCFSRATEIWNRVGDLGQAGSSHSDIATVLERMGRTREAAGHLAKAVVLLEKHRELIGGLSEMKSGYLEAQISSYHRLIDLQLRLGHHVRAFDTAQKTKARSLNDMIRVGRVRHSVGLSEDDLRMETSLRQRADDLNRMMVAEGVRNEPGSKQRFARLQLELRDAERELTGFLDRLYIRNPQIARQRAARTVSAGSIGRMIPPDTALIDMVDLRGSGNAGRSMTAVFVARSDGRLRAFRVDSRGIDRVATSFRAACASPGRNHTPLGRRLYDTLIRPIERSLAGVKRIIVCPDGALWDVPFQAITMPDGRYLVERYEIGYAHSATGVEAMRQAGNPRAPTKTLFAMANPAFGDGRRFGDKPATAGQRPIDSPSRPIDSPSRSLTHPTRALAGLPASIITRGGGIASLPGTQLEADGLRAIFSGASVYTGANAQEAVAKRDLGEFRYIHFATHGFVNDAAPLLSSIVLAAPSQPGEDGFLTARELFQLDLTAELVTLSACNTARGERRSGEGLIGLTWALFAAGARAQVVSQWAVDDANTATWMKRFYGGIATGRPKGTSLRIATLSLLREARSSKRPGKWQHPYYWAPFILMGDWR